MYQLPLSDTVRSIGETITHTSRGCNKLERTNSQVGRIQERSDAAPATRLTMPEQRFAWSGLLLLLFTFVARCCPQECPP